MSEITLKLPEFSKRNLYLSKEIDMSVYEELQKEISRIKTEDEATSLSIYQCLSIFGIDTSHITLASVNMYVNSPGGDAYSGLALYDLIDSYNRNNGSINTHCGGLCASAAVLPFLAGNTRTCGKNATFMIHSPSTLLFGKSKQLEEDVKEVQRIEKKYFDIILKRTKITKEKITEVKNTKQDYWINAEQAKALDIVDNII